MRRKVRLQLIHKGAHRQLQFLQKVRNNLDPSLIESLVHRNGLASLRLFRCYVKSQLRAHYLALSARNLPRLRLGE